LSVSSSLLPLPVKAVSSRDSNHAPQVGQSIASTSLEPDVFHSRLSFPTAAGSDSLRPVLSERTSGSVPQVAQSLTGSPDAGYQRAA